MTKPCRVCGRQFPMLGTMLCDPCWEVDRSLEHVLSTKQGRRHIAERLREAETTET